MPAGNPPVEDPDIPEGAASSGEVSTMPPMPDWFGAGDDLSPSKPTGSTDWIDLELPDFSSFANASTSGIFGHLAGIMPPESAAVPESDGVPLDDEDRSFADTPTEESLPDSLGDLYLPGQSQTADVLERLLAEFPDAATTEIPVPSVHSTVLSSGPPIVPPLFPTAPEILDTSAIPDEGLFPEFGSMLPELAAVTGRPFDLPDLADPSPAEDPLSASSSEIRTLRIPPETGLAASVLNYGLVATIGGSRPFYNFRVEHAIPPGVRLLGCEPMPSNRNGDRLTWDFGTLNPGDKYRIQMRVETAGRTPLQADTFAAFDTLYSHATTHQTRVTRTVLEATLAAPAVVELGDAVEFVAQVANTGNWPATATVLTFRLPDGFEHPDGREVAATPGRIAPGETVRVSISAKALRAGSAETELVVDCSEGGRTTARAETTIAAPEMRIDLLPPVRITVGQTADVRLDVRNVGTGTATNLRANVRWPDGLEFVKADHSGKSLGRQAVWAFDDLAVGATVTLRVTLKPTLPGDYRVLAGASFDRTAPMSAEGAIRAEIDVRQNVRDIDEFVALVNSQESSLVRDLANIAAPTRNAADRAAVDLLQQHILFQSGETEYALPIGSVVEVGRSRTIVPLPNVADWLLGLSNLRGDVISVVDLRRFLGLEPTPLAAGYRVIVVRAGRDGVTAALVVDRISGTAVIPDAAIHMPTSPIDDPVAPYMKGVTEREGRLLVMLDAERLLLSRAFSEYAS